MSQGSVGGPSTVRRPVGELVAVCTVHEVRPDPGRKGRTAIDKRPRAGAVTVGAEVLQGDLIADEVHHGGRDQAVHAYAREDAERWAAELGVEVAPGWFGENLAVRGLAVSDAVVGERWHVGPLDGAVGAGVLGTGVLLEVTLPRTPCPTFGRWVEQQHWVKRFAERADTGAYLRVVRPGTVRAGDAVTVLSRPSHGATVRDVFTGAHPARLALLLADGVDVPPKAVTAAQRVLARV